MVSEGSLEPAVPRPQGQWALAWRRLKRGRVEFLRLLYGGRVSLEVAVGAALVALVLGIVLGSVAGYFGGLVDAVISRFTDLVMAFPLLFFLVLIGSLFNYGLTRWTLHGF